MKIRKKDINSIFPIIIKRIILIFEVVSKFAKSKLKYFDCLINNASLFENEKYDVLKFDVSGNGLKETNKELQKYPFTSDYPEYHPHLTIGYLHPGKGKKYTKLLQNREYKLIPKYAVYSKPDGSKTKMTIKKKGPK